MGGPLKASIKKRIQKRLEAYVEVGTVPGAQLSLGWRDQSLGTFVAGSRDPRRKSSVSQNTLFDLSSLTKIVSTVSLMMDLFQEGKINSLSMPLKSFFPSLTSNLKERSLEDVLNHRAGLPAVFEETEEFGDRDQRVRHFLQRIDEIYQKLSESTPEEVDRFETKYSDVGFMLLGILVEQLGGKRLRQLFPQNEELRYGPLKPAGEWLAWLTGRTQLAASLSLEFQPTWLKGVVQDPRAQWLDGDAGHAGLFGSSRALERWAHELYMCFEGKGLRWSDQVVRSFLNFEAPHGRFLNGFDTPETDGTSQAGTEFSEMSVGHLGYSGTSLWMDMETGARVSLLSHRFWEGGDSNLIREERPKLHDWLHQEVFGKIRAWTE